MNYGSRAIDEALTFYANTHDAATGAATDADAVPDYRVYENETATPLLTGSMAKLDDANTTGFYSEAITLSAANGFETGKTYGIYITATVDSVVGTTHHTFQMTAPVNVTHAAGTAWGSGAITAAAIATNAIDDDALAPDAVTAIQSGLATAAALAVVDDLLDTEIAAIKTDTAAILLDTGTDGVVVASFTTAGKAEIQQEATDSLNAYDPPTKAELDAAVSPLATAAALDVVDNLLDTEIAAIKTDTAAILLDTGTDGVVVASLTTAAKAEVQAEAADALNAYDPPTKAELDTAIDGLPTAAEINAEVVDALATDTYAELTDVPAATSSLKDKLTWLFMLARNRITQTETTTTIYADDATTALSTATVSDDTTTFDRGELTP